MADLCTARNGRTDILVKCPYCQPDNDVVHVVRCKGMYSEKIMDEIVGMMVRFLKDHETWKLLELVADAVATKEQA